MTVPRRLTAARGRLLFHVAASNLPAGVESRRRPLASRHASSLKLGDAFAGRRRWRGGGWGGRRAGAEE